MAEAFSRSVLRVALAQVCQSLGWNSVQSTPLEVMTDVLERYILEIGKYTHRYCEQFGRTEPNLDDLGLAFQELGISVPELQDFLKHVDPLPFAFDVPKFPVPRENMLNFPKPGSRELAEREEHIDDHYPPMHPEWNDDVPQTPTAETPTPRTTDPTGLTSPAISAEKRNFDKFLSPDSSLKKTKTLPDEAGHSKYEMKGVSMSDHGYLTPTKQGKLPEARTPPPPVSVPVVEAAPVSLPKPLPSLLPKTEVTSETIVVHSPENSDQEFDIIDMPPSPETPVVMTKPKVKKSPKGKPRSKSPKFQVPKKPAKSPVLPSKKFPFKGKKDVKKKKAASDIDEVDAGRAAILPPPLSPSHGAAGRLADYDDCIDSVLEQSKEIERLEEEDRKRERERKEQEEHRRKKEEKEREERERERERQREREKKEREQREKEKREAERKEREIREKEMETQKMIEEIEMKKRQREEERMRREERQRKEERERLERERRKQGLFLDDEDDDDDVELVYEDPTLPLELRESPTVSPIPREKKKEEKKEKEKSSTKSLKITIGGIQEGKDFKKIQSPEWPKVSLEKLTPEDIRNFEYPSPPKLLPTISEDIDDEQPAIKPIRIGLGGKDFKIKPPRAEDSGKDHKRKKKKKDKDKDRERKKDKKHKKDKKREKKDKEKPKEETSSAPSIPKLTFKFGGSKGSKVTISHTSSDNTPKNSPSKTEEIMSPPGRATALSPVHLSSPIAEPSSPSSPERSPLHKLPFRALHTPSPPSSRSPSPKRGRTESSDSPGIDLEIQRKLSRSPVRESVSMTLPTRNRSPASSTSTPVSPLSPEPAALPVHLATPTVAAKAGKGPPAKGVISETVGKIVDDSGQVVWICPTCKKVDDGTPMIGCDKCDDWYHWVCVGITAEPSDDQWYCERCTLIASSPQRGRGRGRGRGGRGRGLAGRGKGTGNKRGRKKMII